MGVEVDWARIVRVAKRMRWDGEYVLALTTARPYPQQVLDHVLEIDIEESPANGRWYPSPQGWLVMCEGVQLAQLQGWVDRWAAALTDAGVDGQIGPPVLASRQMWAGHIERLQPFEGHFWYQPDDVPDAWKGPWPAATYAAVVDYLAGWVCAAGGKGMVSLAPDAHMWAEPQSIAAVMGTAANAATLAMSRCYDKAGQRIRSVKTGRPGRATVVERRVGALWREEIEVLRSALLGAPRERLVVAAVELNAPVQDRRAHWYLRHPQAWGRFILEPHGLQVLTAAHLEVAHDLSQWEVTRLDESHFLVAARDLGAWYAEHLPYPATFDPQLRAQARADFGAMIVTDAQADTL